MARQMLGDHFNSMNYIQHNASDDRGINLIRNEVKRAAQQGGVGTARKALFFDEADGLTKAAHKQCETRWRNMPSMRCSFLPPTMSRQSFRIAITVYGVSVRSCTGRRCRQLYQRIAHSECLPTEWDAEFEYLNQVCGGDLRSGIDILQSLPRTPDALTERLSVEQANYSDPAMSVAAAIGRTLATELAKDYTDRCAKGCRNEAIAEQHLLARSISRAILFLHCGVG